jgi:hypothetical protein
MSAGCKSAAEGLPTNPMDVERSADKPSSTAIENNLRRGEATHICNPS